MPGTPAWLQPAVLAALLTAVASLLLLLGKYLADRRLADRSVKAMGDLRAELDAELEMLKAELATLTTARTNIYSNLSPLLTQSSQAAVAAAILIPRLNERLASGLSSQDNLKVAYELFSPLALTNELRHRLTQIDGVIEPHLSEACDLGRRIVATWTADGDGPALDGGRLSMLLAQFGSRTGSTWRLLGEGEFISAGVAPGAQLSSLCRHLLSSVLEQQNTERSLKWLMALEELYAALGRCQP